ncbi:MAG TPA: chorismate synthase [Spirochaetota bacterium]|nr:chorismate synthase [Spirochaetota bacterium]HQO40002.1 chorismate synthase [Spirochaetota bacterium]
MNSFGTVFRISIFGESHGNGIGIVIDGTPPGIPFAAGDMEADLARRMPGGHGTTARREPDVPEILSGVYRGFTTGAPVAILFRNSDTRSADYDRFRDTPRPGHADFTATAKYGGFNDPRGSGHFSGRITLALVAAGALAKKTVPGMDIRSQVLEIGGLRDYDAKLKEAIERGDSLGGLIEVRINSLPAGLGEPFFNSLESVISHLVFSVPAVRGIEFGTGFAAAAMQGSEHNDAIVSADGTTATNNSGGINGGITNGNTVLFRVAVKPTPSIRVAQQTINLSTGQTEKLEVTGRHDACIALRAPVVFEACAAIAAADMYLVNRAIYQQEAGQ